MAAAAAMIESLAASSPDWLIADLAACAKNVSTLIVTRSGKISQPLFLSFISLTLFLSQPLLLVQDN